MIALVIGLIVLAGVMRLLVSSRTAYQTSESQAHMLDGARFALGELGRDLRMAGGFGPNSWPSTIVGRRGDTAQLPNAAGDCGAGFYIDLARKVYATDDSTGTHPFVGDTGCIDSSFGVKEGTDLLTVRYAQPTAIPDAELVAKTTYVQTRSTRGQLFVGTSAPTVSSDNNFRLVSHVYYVSPHTTIDPLTGAGDNIPSLHRLSLIAGDSGPQMEDEVLVPGVEDLQLQFGVDNCSNLPCDNQVNRYVDADNTEVFGDAAWSDLRAVENINAVRVWLLMREPSDGREVGLDTSGEFVMGSKSSPFENDGIRRKLFSSVVNLRNQGT